MKSGHVCCHQDYFGAVVGELAKINHRCILIKFEERDNSRNNYLFSKATTGLGGPRGNQGRPLTPSGGRAPSDQGASLWGCGTGQSGVPNLSGSMPSS